MIDGHSTIDHRPSKPVKSKQVGVLDRRKVITQIVPTWQPKIKRPPFRRNSSNLNLKAFKSV
jgi:hypothetical protein